MLMGMYYPSCRCAFIGMPIVALYVSAWASALLVLAVMGNAKASSRWTSNGTAPHAFFVYIQQNLKLTTIHAGSCMILIHIVMDDLTFLVSWGANKETAWSGTNYSLYKALNNYYKVKDINLSNLSGNRWVNAILRRLLRMDGASLEYYRRHRLGKKLESINGNVFQFSEVLYDSEVRRTYMYVDNTVSYVNYMRDQLPDTFAVSAFQNTNAEIFSKREKEQDEYIRSCSGLFTMGHWLKEWLIQQGFSSDKIHAVGGGINVDRSLICPQVKTHNKILFVGKDFKRKGGYITYEAFKFLRGQGRNVELYVIGPSHDPIDDPVEGYHFIGLIPFHEEAKYYNMCDVFCMPSYFEAYGLVFVEALTFGLPCIGRNCYEMPYFINDGKTGLLLENDDPHELASLMQQILDNDTFSQNVVSNRPNYIQEYSWSTVAERISSIIK